MTFSIFELLRRFGALVLPCVVMLSACTTPDSVTTGAGGAQAVTPASTAVPAVTATPTEMPSATPTATTAPPTPTSTSVPTATATPPPPTLTPTPTVDTPARFVPPQIGQGESGALVVSTAPGSTVSGALDGRALAFTSTPEGAWAIIGIPRSTPAGPRTANLRVQAADGAVTNVNATLTVTAVNYPLENIELPPGQGSLLDPAIVNREFALIGGLWRDSPPERRWGQGPFLRPAEGEVSSVYGIRRSYNGGPPTGTHEGMDFAANTGWVVRAAAAGKVVVARELVVRGKAVLVDHGMGVVTGYYHLSELSVQEGQDVAAGETLGKVGSTGLATGPHLHWDVIVGGINVNPATWLERAVP